MRKIYLLALLAFLFAGSVAAQEVLVVDPGIGTLNAAVATYGGDRIYELTAGEWYQLDAPIENVDYHLQIIGSEPAEQGGMPATLQTSTDVNGATFATMFDAKGDITLKNIYVVNADLNATVGNVMLTESDSSARIVIDHCVFHPMGVVALVNATAGDEKCFFTNNLAIDHGHQVSPNDGHTFIFGNTNNIGFDTVWIENNTFVCVGMNFFSGNFATDINNLYCVNHNTFVFAKSQIDWCDLKMEQYWTNNLMFDVQVNAYANNWQPMPGGDPSMPKPNLIYADTLPGEVMPSERACFVEYNSLYRAQGFYDLIDEMNVFCAEQDPKLPGVYLYPLVWPPDTLTSREAQMFANDTDWPNFKFNHYMADVDPEFTDQEIYVHEDSLLEWCVPANYIHAVWNGTHSEDYPPATEWPQYWWIPSGDLSVNDVWPVFDGTYANEQTMKGSIERNVPLGDLNWWPEAKAAWEENYDAIWDHMRALNEDQIDIGYGEPLVPAAFPIDFEAETDAEWTVFANGGVNGTGNPGDFMVVDNPDKSGINTSDKVLQFIVNDDADPWAGAYSDSYPAVAFSEAAHTVTMMVWKSDTIKVGFKVEASADGGPATEVKVPVTTTNAWEMVTVDFTAGIGFSYARVVMFPDFPDTRTAGATVYLDNIALGAATGIKDVKSDGLFVYPNPVKDILNVKGSKKVDITIMNIDGRIVRSAKNVSSVNVSDLANGLYSVTIKEGSNVSQQKVLITK